MTGRSRKESQIAAVVRAYDAWAARWAGLTHRDDVLGKVTWTESGWSCKKRVPLLGISHRCVIDDGKAHGDYDTSRQPECPRAWAGRLWSRFCEEWPAERRTEAFELLHAFAKRLANEWVQKSWVRDNPEQVAFIEQYRDSYVHFKRDLKLDDVRLCKYDRRRYVTMHFETDFAEGYGLNLFYIAGRKRLKPTFGDQLGPN